MKLMRWLRRQDNDDEARYDQNNIGTNSVNSFRD